MFKKLISSLLAASMLATFASAASGNTQTAKPSPHAIYVDGTKANVAAYEINGNNYFKLRDIAAIVTGSEKQFEVSWNNAAQRIDLTSGKTYTIVGGELGAIGSASKNAESSTAVVYKDSVKMNYTGYNIDDNNYYKLRDVCESFDIGIKWDGANQRVDILTTESYVPEGQETVEPDQNEEKIYLNGVWIDGIVTVDGKETALIVNGQEYGPDEEFVLNGKTYVVTWDAIFTDQLIPLFQSSSNERPQPPEIPSNLKLNEFTDEYLAYLESSGEPIITKTVKYTLLEKGRPFCHSVKLAVKAVDQDALITMFQSNADGTGEFKLSMTQSDYEAELNDGRKFLVAMANGSALEIDGEFHSIGGGLIGNIGMTGYTLEFQIM